jgi:hypothetical protein
MLSYRLEVQLVYSENRQQTPAMKNYIQQDYSHKQQATVPHGRILLLASAKPQPKAKTQKMPEFFNSTDAKSDRPISIGESINIKG